MRWRSAIVLGPLTLLLLVLSTAAHATPGTWTATGSMTIGRSRHTATLLTSGKVLVAGGNGTTGAALSSAEVYDPSTGVWTRTGDLAFTRAFHTATLLSNGKVLVAGGCCTPTALSTAELYDPGTGVFTPTGSMTSERYYHTATLLRNGKVLVAGGFNNTAGSLSSAELYDPGSGVWTATGSMNAARYLYTATLLQNGKVLVAGGFGTTGDLSSAELYDPGTGVWTVTGSMNVARRVYTATLLPNGKVLAAGGCCAPGAFSSAELYDPGTGVWTATGGLNIGEAGHTAALLLDGTVLLAGGCCVPGALTRAELYHPSTGVWTATGSMTIGRSGHTASLLPSGKVLVAGGLVGTGNETTPTAELYDGPSLATTTTTLSSTPNPSLVGEEVTFTATVSGCPTPPTGTLTFSNGTTALGTSTLPTTTFVTSTLPAGSNSISVSYSGDGNCAPSTSAVLLQQVTAAASLTSPANGSTFTGASQAFSWTTAAGADTYSLWVGATVGGYEYYYCYTDGGCATTTSTTATGLPTDGSTVYVRLWTHFASGWLFNDYSFTAVIYAVISTPPPGSTLSGASQDFTWTSAATADQYALWVGSTVGGYDYYYVYCVCTSTTATGLPTNGSTVYVRLWTSTPADGWTFTDYTYTASGVPPITITVMVGSGGSLFSPANPAAIHAGDTVHWVWAGNNHTVTSGEAGVADNKFCSPNNLNCSTGPTSNTDATFDVTFTQTGTYPYFCRIHVGFGMVGTITVQ